MEGETRYARSGDVHVAYQVFGEGPVDLVFLDGWKNLYLPVLELLTPKLRRGALVVADNANFADARPYLAHVRGRAEFVSALLPGGRMEWSWYLS